MESLSRTEISRILSGLGSAAPQKKVLDRIFPVVYAELTEVASRYLARERPGHSLEPSALVHEVYERLLGARALDVNGRRHFFGIATRAMDQVLKDRARRKRAVKHGGGLDRVTISGVAGELFDGDVNYLDLERTLERLAELDGRAAEVVRYRFFGGLTEPDVAEILGVTRQTVGRDWRFARMWLRSQLSSGG